MHKSISCSWLLRREGFICVGLVMCVCVCARVFSSMTIWKLPQNERQNKTFAAWQICVEFITSPGTISLSPSPNFPPANHLLKIVERKSKKPRWFLKEVKQTKKKKKKKATGPLHRLVLVHWSLGKSTLDLHVNLVNILTMEGKRYVGDSLCFINNYQTAIWKGQTQP